MTPMATENVASTIASVCVRPSCWRARPLDTDRERDLAQEEESVPDRNREADGAQNPRQAAGEPRLPGRCAPLRTSRASPDMPTVPGRGEGASANGRPPSRSRGAPTPPEASGRASSQTRRPRCRRRRRRRAQRLRPFRADTRAVSLLRHGSLVARSGRARGRRTEATRRGRRRTLRAFPSPRTHGPASRPARSSRRGSRTQRNRRPVVPGFPSTPDAPLAVASRQAGRPRTGARASSSLPAGTRGREGYPPLERQQGQ